MNSAREGEFRTKYKILNSYDEHIKQIIGSFRCRPWLKCRLKLFVLYSGVRV